VEPTFSMERRAVAEPQQSGILHFGSGPVGVALMPRVLDRTASNASRTHFLKHLH